MSTRPRAFREGAGDFLVVDHDIAHHHALEQARVQVRLLEALRHPRAHLGRAGGQQLARVLELARVGRIGGEQGVDVAGVVGVELALDDGVGE